MTRVQYTSGGRSLEELVAEDQDLVQVLMGEALQAVLEGEMEDCLQAKKGERTPQRLGYRSGYYERTLVSST